MGSANGGEKGSAPYPVKRQTAESMYSGRAGKMTTEKAAKDDRDKNHDASATSYLPGVRRTIGGK
jgi:hypothetical protein